MQFVDSLRRSHSDEGESAEASSYAVQREESRPLSRFGCGFISQDMNDKRLGSALGIATAQSAPPARITAYPNSANEDHDTVSDT